MMRAFKILLRLYPANYRQQFAGEMLIVFERAAKEKREQGWPVFVRFAVRELIGLVLGAATEWGASLRQASGERLAPVQDLAQDELVEAHKRVMVLVNRMVHAIANHDFEGARRYSAQEQAERENLQRLLRRKYPVGE